MPQGLSIGDDGIRHRQLGSTVLVWTDIVSVDLTSVTCQGRRQNYLDFTIEPESVRRLNAQLPLYRRILLPKIFGYLIRLDITGGTIEPEEIFNAVRVHVAPSQRPERSGLERGFEKLLVKAPGSSFDISHLSSAQETPRPPRGFKDAALLMVTATLVFAVLLTLMIGLSLYVMR